MDGDMKRFLQVLISSFLIFGSTLASASGADSQRPLSGENKVAKSDQIIKSDNRKNRSSKKDQQFYSESRSEDDNSLSRKEIDEMREALGEK
jgi:hypothetical protein